MEWREEVGGRVVGGVVVALLLLRVTEAADTRWEEEGEEEEEEEGKGELVGTWVKPPREEGKENLRAKLRSEGITEKLKQYWSWKGSVQTR